MFISNNKNEKKRNNLNQIQPYMMCHARTNGKEYNSFYLQNP